MPAYTEYRCGVCEQLTDRIRLYIKRIEFARMTKANVTVRKRTKVWICDECLESDSDWNLPAFGGPGHTSAARERIRERSKGQ